MKTLERKCELKAQNDVLLGKAYIRYMYDMENKNKHMEVVYRDKENFGEDNWSKSYRTGVPTTVQINTVSEFFDKDFCKIGESLLIHGYNNVQAVYDYADTLNKALPKPIPVDKKVHKDDLFKFIFDMEGNLVRLQLYAHVDRVGIRNKGNNKTEYKADYADCINNLDETEIVIPEYDTNGNPIQSSQPKDNEEYILFPKARDKKYDKVNYKDY